MKLNPRIKRLFQRAASIPITLTIGLTAIVIACAPSAGSMLQIDREKVLDGEVWRLATGHLTHWNVEHIQWDLLMFVVLGAACELRNPRRMWLGVVAAATSVSVVVFCLFPGIDAYRGLSGIDTALFVLLAVDLLHDARGQHNRALLISTCGLLIGLLAKTAYEAITGHGFFVDQASAGFELLVWDHVAAAAAGAIVSVGIPQQRPAAKTSSIRSRLGVSADAGRSPTVAMEQLTQGAVYPWFRGRAK